MAYNHDVSMANIDNVVEALNEGGVLSCNDIMERVWENATDEQVNRKVFASRNPQYHLPSYARTQVRQEVRRTLYGYFNSVDESPYDIYRVTAHQDVERFFVAEEQDTEASIQSLESTPTLSPGMELLHDDNTVCIQVNTGEESIPTASTIMDALESARKSLNEEFVGQVNTLEVRSKIAERVNSIISELGDTVCLA